jgi:hypothetical protein
MVAYRMALHKPARGYRKDDALTAFIDVIDRMDEPAVSAAARFVAARWTPGDAR